jgi:hypothetical protein
MSSAPKTGGMRRLSQSGRKMSVTVPLSAPSSSTSGVSGQTWLFVA